MMVQTPDGRSLDVLDTGGDGLPVLYHSGTPSGLLAYGPTVEAARAAGLRWISYSRPGYGGSTPQPGRTVVDAATDVATVLGALGVGDFVTYGWSGGGPHALACTTLGARCRRVAVVAGVAPYEAEGLDWYDGMGQDNVEEFAATLQGREALTAYLTEPTAGLARVTADEVIASFGDLLPAVDEAAIAGPFADWFAAALRQGAAPGPAGWVDDDLAFARPWGFGLGTVGVPVTVWQGDLDLMVPHGHGRWLAAHVPGADLRFLPGHGHVSLVTDALPQVFAWLAGAA